MGGEPRESRAAAASLLMEIKWTRLALSDLVRLHDFLAPVNPRAVAKVVQALSRAPERLRSHPRLGERLEEFAPREVRGLLVTSYEMRYEVCDSRLYILRLWHSREDR